jgi:hypothetical protein
MMDVVKSEKNAMIYTDEELIFLINEQPPQKLGSTRTRSGGGRIETSRTTPVPESFIGLINLNFRKDFEVDRRS